jgi:uncharacterized protein (UPF0332 family)
VKSESRALVEYRLTQASESLRSAEIQLADGLCRPAVSRCYYAMFYSVLAVLAAGGQSRSTHASAIARFDEAFIRHGRLEPELSRWLHDAFDLRQRADYREFFEISPKRVQRELERARRFVAAVQQYIAKLPRGAAP